MRNIEIAELYERDLRKLISEIISFEREENLWRTFGSIKNSCGNLALHLIGGMNFLIGTTLANTGYIRNRDQEFSGEPIARNILIKELENLVFLVPKTINALTQERFETPYPIFFDKENATIGYVLTQLLIHLNYHLGQINYLRRSLE
jgi:hypothetical protein